MITGTSPVLTKSQLHRVIEHKYNSQGRSLIEPIFQKLWNYQVSFVPNYVHPNCLTLMGFISVMSGLVLFIYYSPDMKHGIPKWCYLLNALLIFMYQSFDAIDGKHARKTGLSSLVGEIWDHGFDSIITGALAIEFCITLRLGNNVDVAFLSILLALINFYTAHWETFCTGVIEFGKFDVTETLTIFITGNLLNGILGDEYWSTHIFYNIKLNELFLSCMIFVSVLIISLRIYRIIMNKGIGHNGTTLGETSILSPVVPIMLFTILYFSIFFKSKAKNDIMSKFYAYHLLFCFSISKTTIRLIVASMTHSEFHFVDTEFAVPAFLFFNQYFGYIIPENFYILYASLCICMIDFWVYFIRLTFALAKVTNTSILFPNTHSNQSLIQSKSNTSKINHTNNSVNAALKK